MNEFLQFLKDNYQILGSAVILVGSLLLTLIKKKPVFNLKDELLLEIYDYLPTWCIAAEQKFGSGHGPEKLKWVLCKVVTFLGIDSDLLKDSNVYNRLKLQIEDILSAPQKKAI